ncbi:hypothetical protein PAHAL_5G450800 [Panicum hallii]|uniref:Uncharacterized protein n=1 Tax=Panicum hallii TaxID=206008 RepID=A0A2S3HX82_9POAL|nr:hypothetical protein PAHAL_5G450800 [Panicum hallii]
MTATARRRLTTGDQSGRRRRIRPCTYNAWRTAGRPGRRCPYTGTASFTSSCIGGPAGPPLLCTAGGCRCHACSCLSFPCRPSLHPPDLNPDSRVVVVVEQPNHLAGAP